MVKFNAIYSLIAIAYTVFDIGIVVIILLVIFALVRNQLSGLRAISQS
jgi:hypothetical protein